MAKAREKKPLVLSKVQREKVRGEKLSVSAGHSDLKCCYTSCTRCN